jgi:drug/metabolite transporter superfamily protein YnfA
MPTRSSQSKWHQLLQAIFVLCLLQFTLLTHASVPFVQQAYLKASNTDQSDWFGDAVAISGNTLVVGVQYEDSDGSSQDDNSDSDAGAVYVFVRNGNSWSQQAYLKASNIPESDRFGISVAISGDTLVVGAPQEWSDATGVNGERTNSAEFSGAAYVFVRSGETWSQQAYLKASNTGEGDQFGVSVAISDDTVVVGAYGEKSNATGVDGDQLDDSLTYAGAAYVFNRVEETWSQQAYLKASNTGVWDWFGETVAIDGNTIVVGASRERSNGRSELDDSLIDAGAAYVFFRSGETWSQQAYLKAKPFSLDRYDNFGKSVAISNDTIVVGTPGEDSNGTFEGDDSAPDAGSAYVFVRSDGNWSIQAWLKASNISKLDLFGGSVSVSGNTIVVGATGEDSDDIGVGEDGTHNFYAPDSGAAYIFERNNTIWDHTAYVKASNTDADDAFGSAVAVSGIGVAIAAVKESSGATGVNGDQTNNDVSASGAVYVFKANIIFKNDFE